VEKERTFCQFVFWRYAVAGKLTVKMIAQFFEVSTGVLRQFDKPGGKLKGTPVHCSIGCARIPLKPKGRAPTAFVFVLDSHDVFGKAVHMELCAEEQPDLQGWLQVLAQTSRESHATEAKSVRLHNQRGNSAIVSSAGGEDRELLTVAQMAHELEEQSKGESEPSVATTDVSSAAAVTHGHPTLDRAESWLGKMQADRTSHDDHSRTLTATELSDRATEANVALAALESLKESSVTSEDYETARTCKDLRSRGKALLSWLSSAMGQTPQTGGATGGAAAGELANLQRGGELPVAKLHDFFEADLKTLDQQLAEIEVKKRTAVESENFELAKTVKVEVEALVKAREATGRFLKNLERLDELDEQLAVDSASDPGPGRAAAEAERSALYTEVSDAWWARRESLVSTTLSAAKESGDAIATTDVVSQDLLAKQAKVSAEFDIHTKLAEVISRPLDKTPLAGDLPRLAAKYTVHGAPWVEESKEGTPPLENMIISTLAALEQPETVQDRAAQWRKTVTPGKDSTGRENLEFLRDLGEDSPTTRVLKSCSQGAIAPGVGALMMATMQQHPQLGFKDQSWTVELVVAPDEYGRSPACCSLTHFKSQTHIALPNTPALFEFTWRLQFVFDSKGKFCSIEHGMEALEFGDAADAEFRAIFKRSFGSFFRTSSADSPAALSRLGSRLTAEEEAQLFVLTAEEAATVARLPAPLERSLSDSSVPNSAAMLSSNSVKPRLNIPETTTPRARSKWKRLFSSKNVNG
jgi:hypothetical protein